MFRGTGDVFDLEGSVDRQTDTPLARITEYNSTWRRLERRPGEGVMKNRDDLVTVEEDPADSWMAAGKRSRLPPRDHAGDHVRIDAKPLTLDLEQQDRKTFRLLPHKLSIGYGEL